MTNKILVWDLPVRLFHWLLVIALVCAWYTSDGDKGLIEYHPKIGYFILGLIIFRIAWGIIGTKYAKFYQFLPSKQSLVNYVEKDKNVSTVGHNPLGGLMIVLMITLILLQAISGLFMNDDVFTAGPYYQSVSLSVQNIMSTIHHNVFNVILAVSALHISAAMYYLLVKKVNLIIPMFTGYKISANNKDKGISSSKLLLAAIIIIATVMFIYWLVVINIPVEETFYF